MTTGDTPSVPTAAPAAPAPAAPVASPTPAPSTPETPGGSGTPAPVTASTFADEYAKTAAKMKADADAKKAERAAKKAEAAETPPVEPTTMPATTDTPANDTDETPAEETGADAKVDETPTPVVKKADGPVPLDRHKRAVENARAKGAEEAVSEVVKHYPWVGEVDPKEIAQALALRDAVRKNPSAVAQRLLARGGGAPAPGTAPGPADVMAEPDLQTEDGKHRMYSEKAHKQSLAVLARRLGQAFESQLAEVKAFIAEQRQTAQQSHAERIVTDRVESLLRLPGAQEHLAEIVDLMERDGRLSDVGAYNRVVPPRLAAENARLKAEKAEAELRFKAGAGTLNPSGAGTGTTGKRTYRTTVEGFGQALKDGAR